MNFIKIPGKEFEMSIYQCTQLEWQEHTGSTPSHFKGSGNLPVEKVSWNDVQEFIKTINDKNDGYTYRLPTEEEWEFCCRAGNPGDYCFGDDVEQLNDYAWYWKNAESRTHPVGEKKPNAFGLFDMHGNVWEWCDDSWSPSSSSRVLRGGSWYTDASYTRSAFRYVSGPGDAYSIIGFRLVRTSRSSKTLLPSNSSDHMSLNEVKQRMWKSYRTKARREFLKLWNEAMAEEKKSV